jgi:hypothetical protein
VPSGAAASPASKADRPSLEGFYLQQIEQVYGGLRQEQGPVHIARNSGFNRGEPAWTLLAGFLDTSLDRKA